MGEFYSLSRQQIEHMRARSDFHLAQRRETKGPYAAPPEAPPEPSLPLPVATTVSEMVSDGDLGPLKPPPRSSKEYLKRRLHGRVEIPSAALYEDAKRYGFSEKMLGTAKNALKIRVFQQDRAWWWLLTEDR